MELSKSFDCVPHDLLLAELLTYGAGIVIRNRYPGNTDRLNRNLYVMLKFTERSKAPGMTSKNTLLFLKGISCLQKISC